MVQKPKHLEKQKGNMAGAWLNLLWLIAAVGLAAAGYLITSGFVYGVGFPLDDAWIHQTYARNLGWNGEWAYFPGQPSAGSTSPLWTAALAVGYALRLPYFAWTFLLGASSLLAVAWAGEILLRDYLPSWRVKFPLAGLFLAAEWHLAWASVSGMETLLHAAVILLTLRHIGRVRGRGWAQIGLLCGLGVWIRPDAITLVGPAVFMILLVEPGWKERLTGLVWLVAGLGLFFIPYLLFNFLVQGSVWPNTMYAKQAEYASLRLMPLLERYWNELKLPLIGSGVFLLPGFIGMVWKALKEKNWNILAGAAWFAGYGLVYALQLPVTYQYGRYFIPAMPVYFILGLAGTILLVERLRPSRVGWLLARVGMISMGLVWLAFYLIGANRYAQDVAIIETEMVIPARWIATNTPPDAFIAAHDIGAAGYFANRRLVDLAGLISPEVIPIIRNEARLAEYLDSKNIDYLVVLEGWYVELPQGKEVIYRSRGTFAPASGGSNMVVYRWK